MRLRRLKSAQQRDRNARPHHRGDLHAAGIVAGQIFYPEQKLKHDRHAFKNIDPVFLNAFEQRHRIDLVEDHQGVASLRQFIANHRTDDVRHRQNAAADGRGAGDLHLIHEHRILH